MINPYHHKKPFILSNSSLVSLILALATLLEDLITGKEIRFPLVHILPVGLRSRVKII